LFPTANLRDGRDAFAREASVAAGDVPDWLIG